MGTVVTLPPRQAMRATAPRTDAATILLFMGVRYVRDLEPAEVAEPDNVDPEPVVVDDLPPLEIA